MAIRSKISNVNRAIALALALVWLGAGVVGIVLGLIHDQVLLVGFALFAISYAVLWFRVVTRSRLLSWRELIVPWRDQ
jgi:predicted branched-subunit amino acid permease